MKDRELSSGGTMYRDEEKLLALLPKEKTQELRLLINERHKLKIALGGSSRFKESFGQFFERVVPKESSEEVRAKRAELMEPDPEIQAMFTEALNNTIKEAKVKQRESVSKSSDDELQSLLVYCLDELKKEIAILKEAS